jgi:hypothetical protein
MTIRSRLERLEAKMGASQGGRMIVVPMVYGEPKEDALKAAAVAAEPSDLVVFVTQYGGGHFDRTPTISVLPKRKCPTTAQEAKSTQSAKNQSSGRRKGGISSRGSGRNRQRDSFGSFFSEILKALFDF